MWCSLADSDATLKRPTNAHVIVQSIVQPLGGSKLCGAYYKTFLFTPFIASAATAHTFDTSLSIPFNTFQHIQTIVADVVMATTSQAVAVVMSSVTNASGEHVEEIIKALKSLPQCKNLNTQATKMSTLSGVKKSAPKGQKAEGKGPKRPLNSWMAFRSKSLALTNTSTVLTFPRVLQPDAQSTHSKSQVEDPHCPLEGRSVRSKVVYPREELQHPPWQPRKRGSFSRQVPQVLRPDGRYDPRRRLPQRHGLGSWRIE
jgi:hypothetical protein